MADCVDSAEKSRISTLSTLFSTEKVRFDLKKRLYVEKMMSKKRAQKSFPHVETC